MFYKFLFFFLIYSGCLYSQTNNPITTQSISESNLACNTIDTLFFDLGDTIIESNGNGMFQLRSGVSEMIETLVLREINLGIITNVPSDWVIGDLEDILIDPSFLKDFEVVVLSSLSPSAKPDPAIYNFAYSLLSNPPSIEQVIFVTESLDHIANLEVNPTLGARSVGMLGIHLSDLTPSPLTNYTIASDDFQAIINILNDLLFCDGFEAN